jgi:hypothetical protein
MRKNRNMFLWKKKKQDMAIKCLLNALE